MDGWGTRDRERGEREGGISLLDWFGGGQAGANGGPGV
jgi:hypothetical protein